MIYNSLDSSRIIIYLGIHLANIYKVPIKTFNT